MYFRGAYAKEEENPIRQKSGRRKGGNNKRIKMEIREEIEFTSVNKMRTEAFIDKNESYFEEQVFLTEKKVECICVDFFAAKIYSFKYIENKFDLLF